MEVNHYILQRVAAAEFRRGASAVSVQILRTIVKEEQVCVRGSRTANNLTDLQIKPLNGDYDAFCIVIEPLRLVGNGDGVIQNIASRVSKERHQERCHITLTYTEKGGMAAVSGLFASSSTGNSCPFTCQRCVRER
jgi:hypothetical protein